MHITAKVNEFSILIPILDKNKTIQWLLHEIIHRCEIILAKKPEIEYLSLKSSILYENDNINILEDGDIVVANVKNWKIGSLIDIFKKQVYLIEK